MMIWDYRTTDTSTEQRRLSILNNFHCAGTYLRGLRNFFIIHYMYQAAYVHKPWGFPFILLYLLIQSASRPENTGSARCRPSQGRLYDSLCWFPDDALQFRTEVLVKLMVFKGVTSSFPDVHHKK
uniref:Uncharacterized protein n=1 Tax=Opuntia streptacantha TaxID=393608 RepID=A0A7C9AR20_OPUST